MDNNRFDFKGCSWIWIPQKTIQVNQYVEFSREFIVTNIEEASIFISCDTNYSVWLNGAFVNCGQYKDYPHYKVYDELNMKEYLIIGENKLCIQAYYQGEDSGNYNTGQPALIYLLQCGDVRVYSDVNTQCRISSSYKSGNLPKNQIGFTYEYDARMEDEWLLPSYDDIKEWKPARRIENHLSGLSLYKRPISKSNIMEKIPCNIIAQGVFKRFEKEDKDVARMMNTDYLSARSFYELFKGNPGFILNDNGLRLHNECIQKNDGVYLIIDLGREESGLFHLCLSAEEGTIIDIGYGEHLDDMRVRTLIETRHFASRYICKEGNQTFTHYFSRMGGRYIQVHVHIRNSDRLVINYIGIKPEQYPIQEKGAFQCSDKLHQNIYETAVRTLHLCMHEHYEDTPWREQALYAMDSRNQALCGYYCFGEYQFAKASFRLLSKSLRKDGYLDLCPPGRVAITIPTFTFAWIIEIKEYFLYTGDIKFIRENLEIIESIIEKRLGEIKNELLVTPKEIEYWNFYDWADNLSGEPIFRKEELKSRYDAPYNLFFCLALESAAFLMEHCEKEDIAIYYRSIEEKIKYAFHKQFWNNDQRLYSTYLSTNTVDVYSELVQSLSICAGVVPKELQSDLLEKIANKQNKLTKTTLSMSIFKYMALLTKPEDYAKIVFDDIAKDWGNMLFHNATSFWETQKGASDFENAGSLCHGWSAIPVYFYYSYILGVRPVKPGFKEFVIQPIMAGFYKAKGIVPTPYGKIYIEWEKRNENLKIVESYPPDIKKNID